jgi:hypothetical protein
MMWLKIATKSESAREKAGKFAKYFALSSLY